MPRFRIASCQRVSAFTIRMSVSYSASRTTGWTPLTSVHERDPGGGKIDHRFERPVAFSIQNHRERLARDRRPGRVGQNGILGRLFQHQRGKLPAVGKLTRCPERAGYSIDFGGGQRIEGVGLCQGDRRRADDRQENTADERCAAHVSPRMLYESREE